MDDRQKIKNGDCIYTPRFLNVRIEKVYKTIENARNQGFTEPTHYENPYYEILGKSIGMNRMIFVAARKSTVSPTE